MHDLTNDDTPDALLHEPMAVLLKHGMHCPISGAARKELTAFAARHPDVPVYTVEVTEQRALSDALAERLGVAHQSPQVFVLRAGEPVWHAEHFAISVRALEQQLAE